MNTIEAVATAICGSMFITNNGDDAGVDRHVEICWRGYVPEAKAAIQALIDANWSTMLNSKREADAKEMLQFILDKGE